MDGYCLACKKLVTPKDWVQITMKNGKHASLGTCPTCGRKIYKLARIKPRVFTPPPPHKPWWKRLLGCICRAAN